MPPTDPASTKEKLVGEEKNGADDKEGIGGKEEGSSSEVGGAKEAEEKEKEAEDEEAKRKRLEEEEEAKKKEEEEELKKLIKTGAKTLLSVLGEVVTAKVSCYKRGRSVSLWFMVKLRLGPSIS